jgi:hypothetical protein
MEEHHEGMLPVVESVDVSSGTISQAARRRGRPVGRPLPVRHRRGADLGDAVQHAALGRVRQRRRHTCGFAFATVILTIFSVGYVAMARKVTAAGGFYSFISHGLGRELGMAAGYASALAYSVFEASLCGGFAFFASRKLNQYGYDRRLGLAGAVHGRPDRQSWRSST